MGCCSSKSSPEKAKDDEISKQLKGDAAQLENELKLLLLGAGESGKSTIFKQLKIIHMEGFSPEECQPYKEVVQENTVQSAQALIVASVKLGYPVQAPEAKAACERIMDIRIGGQEFPETCRDDIKLIWKDPMIQKTFLRKAEFQLNDSATYFFQAVERIFSPGYIPSAKDVLHSRIKTSGIIEMRFMLGGLHILLVDVGGQRSERRKWIRCFQDVTAVIFVTSLSEYDQTCFEDNATNRMKESLLLFDEICNNHWFRDTPVILFLNKTDLFREKIKRVDLNVCFPDYDGGKDYEKAATYILDRFLELNRNPRKTIFSHFTCAMDADNIQFVFAAVRDIILQEALSSSGLL